MSHLGNFAYNVGQRIEPRDRVQWGSTRWYSWVHSSYNWILCARQHLRSWSIRFAESNR